jgi:hypothetical protein
LPYLIEQNESAFDIEPNLSDFDNQNLSFR